MNQSVKVIAQGTVMAQPNRVLGYAAWPSVTKDAEGDLVVAFSGNRIMHVCPYGKVLLRKSRDEGRTWSAPIIGIDTPLDDRDAGILYMGNPKMLLSTFNNSRAFQKKEADRGGYGPRERTEMVKAYVSNVTDEMEQQYLGSLISVSSDNGFSWQEPVKVPVSAPHGPNLLADGSLIYAGTPVGPKDPDFPIAVYHSKDGYHFHKLADVPKCPEFSFCNYAEPHILELPSKGDAASKLLLHIRIDEPGKPYEERIFSILQSISEDGGKTWSIPAPTGAEGAPPHLLRHSSGAVICSYGRRKPPYGLEAMVSWDERRSWTKGYTLWDKGETADLGYPCTTELANGDLFTVYYMNRKKVQSEAGNYWGMASIEWIRWRMPQ